MWIAPFWFSTEHRWIVIMPFWFSAYHIWYHTLHYAGGWGWETEQTSIESRRALSIFKDVPLRTRKALSLYNINGDSALLVLNRTWLNSDNALLVFSWHLVSHVALCRRMRTSNLTNIVSLGTRRALALYKVYGSSALLVLNGTSLNSDNALLVLSLSHVVLSSMQEDEDEKLNKHCQLRARRALSYSKMFHWEPEGRYHCTKSTAIAPFWFSTEHRWIVITPFCFSAD